MIRDKIRIVLNMKKFLQCCLTVLHLSSILTKNDNFDENILQKCPLTEYGKYLKCVQEHFFSNATHLASIEIPGKEKESNCQNCNCNICEPVDFGEFSENNCCKECCPFTPCTTRHCCFKTCHSGCKSLDCRFSCRKSCSKFIENQENDHKFIKSDSSHIFDDEALNITTTINLKNRVDNVNNMNMPIRVSSSNLNDITIDENSEYNNQNAISNTPCCEEVKPIKCTSAEKFPFIKCHSNKTSQCDTSCQSKDLQKTSRDFCDSSKNGCVSLILAFPPSYPTNEPVFNLESRKYIDSILLNSSKNASVESAWFNQSQQYFPSQQFFEPNVIPNFVYPPISYNTYDPMTYYQSSPFFTAPISFTSNFLPPYFPSPIYQNSLLQNPSVYNSIPSQQILPFYNSFPQLQLPQTSLPSFQTVPSPMNYQIPNSLYQQSQFNFPPIYTQFVPSKIEGNVLANPYTSYSLDMTRPKSDAEILIGDKSKMKDYTGVQVLKKEA